MDQSVAVTVVHSIGRAKLEPQFLFLTVPSKGKTIVYYFYFISFFFFLQGLLYRVIVHLYTLENCSRNIHSSYSDVQNK